MPRFRVRAVSGLVGEWLPARVLAEHEAVVRRLASRDPATGVVRMAAICEIERDDGDVAETDEERRRREALDLIGRHGRDALAVAEDGLAAAVGNGASRWRWRSIAHQVAVALDAEAADEGVRIEDHQDEARPT